MRGFVNTFFDAFLLSEEGKNDHGTFSGVCPEYIVHYQHHYCEKAVQGQYLQDKFEMPKYELIS